MGRVEVRQEAWDELQLINVNIFPEWLINLTRQFNYHILFLLLPTTVNMQLSSFYM